MLTNCSWFPNAKVIVFSLKRILALFSLPVTSGWVEAKLKLHGHTFEAKLKVHWVQVEANLKLHGNQVEAKLTLIWGHTYVMVEGDSLPPSTLQC